jgi:hypothetical protein
MDALILATVCAIFLAPLIGLVGLVVHYWHETRQPDWTGHIKDER